MDRYTLAVTGLAIGCVVGFSFARSANTHAATASPEFGFAAVPGSVGGEDLTGPYELVKDWPKDISSLPGHEKWTWGAGQSIFAESANRVYVLFRGELPQLSRPAA